MEITWHFFCYPPFCYGFFFELVRTKSGEKSKDLAPLSSLRPEFRADLFSMPIRARTRDGLLTPSCPSGFFFVFALMTPRNWSRFSYWISSPQTIISITALAPNSSVRQFILSQLLNLSFPDPHRRTDISEGSRTTDRQRLRNVGKQRE